MLIVELIAMCSVFSHLATQTMSHLVLHIKFASIENQMAPNLAVGENSLQAPEL